MVNVSWIVCSDEVTKVYHETVKPRFYNRDITIEQLSLIVSNNKIQFSPFNYTNNIKSKDSWDNSKQNTLWLDFDDGFSIEQAKQLFKKNTYIIYTTKTHQKEKKGLTCDRFRIILPAKNIPQGELYFAMMEELANLLPIDKQVNTKTGSFLGNDGEVYIKYGEDYDCSYLHSLAEYRLANKKKQVQLKEMKRLDNLRDAVHTLNVNDLKNYLDEEDTLNIIHELGYEVNSWTRKFKRREDERTHSCKVYSQGYWYDYGSGEKGDVLDLIQEKHNIDFVESMKYVEDYLRSKDGDK